MVPWEVVEDICLAVPDDWDILTDRSVKMGDVGDPVGGNSLIQQSHLNELMNVLIQELS